VPDEYTSKNKFDDFDEFHYLPTSPLRSNDREEFKELKKQLELN
jgi:hypothetical protein